MVPAGLSIAEIVELIQPDPLLRAHGVAFIGEHPVARDRSHRVRPRPGALISIRLLSSGGGGLRIGLMVIVAVAAIALTIATAGATSPLLFGLSGATWGMIGAAAISLTGTLLINTLLPPPVPKLSQTYGNESPTYAITGARNQARPWEKVPFLCGRFKLTPGYAAMPYREVVGADTYWRALFALGHGPIQVDEIRIGETLLSSFQGVETEFRRGYWSMPNRGSWDASAGAFPVSPAFGDTWTCTVAGTVAGYAFTVGRTITYNGITSADQLDGWDRDQEKPFSLYPDDVFEDALAAAVKHATPVLRASQANADELAIELVFERGLVHIQNAPPGKRSDSSVAIRIEQSPTGRNNWTTVWRERSPVGRRRRSTGAGAGRRATTVRPTPTVSTTFASAVSAAIRTRTATSATSPGTRCARSLPATRCRCRRWRCWRCASRRPGNCPGRSTRSTSQLARSSATTMPRAPPGSGGHHRRRRRTFATSCSTRRGRRRRPAARSTSPAWPTGTVSPGRRSAISTASSTPKRRSMTH